VSTYQIAEVAKRTGFTPATLRYYEDIGLMAPTGRTAAGYRIYDDASLARLRFIARAKQLGCSLDEITELATAWDGGECGPVQQRLQAAVAAKITHTQDRIAELTTFTAELQQAAAALSRHRPDGPCDDSCGCTTTTLDPPAGLAGTSAGAGATVDRADGDDATAVPGVADVAGTGDVAGTAGSSSGGTSVSLVASDDAAGGVPIACTLEAGEMSGRLDDWRAVLDGVTGRSSLDGGVRLRFQPDADVTEIARLAAAEQGCCRFFDFAVVIDGQGIALDVHAPPHAADVVTAVFGAPDERVRRGRRRGSAP
jgi:MerR family transcriptional regulator, copper efflux regulator